MVQLLNSFNPMEFDPSQGGSAWPLGKHPVIIESAEVKPTKDNSSGYLQLNLKVIDGPNAGHVGAYRLNLYNQSQEAAQIAHRQLSAVCHVTQTFQLGPDGTQLQYLFNKPFVIEVGMQKGQEAQEKGYTEIKRVYDMAGNEPGKTGQAQQQAPQGFQQQPQQQQAPQGGFNGGQQQQPQGGQQGGAQAWGGQGQGQQDAPAQQGQQAAGWGQQGGQGQQQPAQQAPQQQAGGWAQGQGGGAPAGGQPAWGQRN